MDPRNTRTDMRLTRSPADTPRGRLHRFVAIATRGAQEARYLLLKLKPSDLTRLRTNAKRGAERAEARIRGPQRGQFGAFVEKTLYEGLDRALGALELYAQLGVVELCESLTQTLVLLEVAETKVAELEVELDAARRDAAVERGQSDQLRTSLAAHQVRAAAATSEVPEERWEEPTRNRVPTEQELRVISDPDAEPGDLERHLGAENEALRRERVQRAGTIADLRQEARALYASYVAMIGRLRAHESTEGAEVQRRHFHGVLTRLGALDAQ